jgi:MFS family permease
MINRQQTLLLLPLGTAMALSLTGDLTMYAVLASQTELLGIGLGVVGVLLGANRMIRIPGNLVAGGIYDRSRRRPLFLLGLALGIVSTFSYSLVQGFWPLLAGRVLWGISWSLINVGGYNMILDWSGPEDRGRMAGLYQVAFMLGLTVSPILGGSLTDALGFRQAVRVCAAVSAVGLLVALVALPETAPGRREGPESIHLRALRQRMRQWLEATRTVNRSLLAASYVYLVVLFVNSGVLMSTISLYIEQRWGTALSIGDRAIGVASLGGLLLAMRSLLGILGGPAAGALSDRIGDRWPVVRGGLLLGSLGFVVLVFLQSVGAVPTGVALVSLSAGGLVATLVALVGDLAEGQRQGLAVGGLATAGDIGSATGPPLAYGLAVVVGLRWVYLFCVLALVSALLVAVPQRALPIVRRSKEEQ